MRMGESLKIGTKEIAAIAVMGALTTVATMTIQVPFPARAEAFFLGMGIEAALAEMIINIPQAIGSVLGVLISLAVKDRLKL
jgi:uncharacterized membrane protein